MIFVTLGTQDKQFKRLLEAVDKAIEKGEIKEKVVCQTGSTKYESKNMEIIDYMDEETFSSYLKKCDILITHGGVGTILTAVQMGKKIIAAPRLSKYKEHVNDHQLQIVDTFTKAKYLLPLENFDELGKVINKVKKFKPEKFVSKRENLIEMLEDYIDNI